MFSNSSSKGHLRAFNLFKLSQKFHVMREFLMHAIFFVLNVVTVALIPAVVNTADNPLRATSKNDTSTEDHSAIARDQCFKTFSVAISVTVNF